MHDDFVVAELDMLAKLGPRFPGSDAHERLVAHVAGQWAPTCLLIMARDWPSAHSRLVCSVNCGVSSWRERKVTSTRRKWPVTP
ncbi:MAG: hypothetical protein WBZ37_01430 [Mycobacterium sp.]